jgi:hypothetical protein
VREFNEVKELSREYPKPRPSSRHFPAGKKAKRGPERPRNYSFEYATCRAPVALLFISRFIFPGVHNLHHRIFRSHAGFLKISSAPAPITTQLPWYYIAHQATRGGDREKGKRVDASL